MKVAAYCRVSTDKDDQINSFSSQQRYFRQYIEHHPDWTLHDIYADEGITGTSTKKRREFNRMISDAESGKFSLILTKEVSRFSRNILDTISYTRRLKAMNVAVLFLTDGINTLDPDAELRLSIMASIAQEESRRTSGRVTWGQTRQMERGVVFGHSMLGYNVKDGALYIEPEGADTVRLIFEKYALELESTGSIAGYLTEQGRRTYSGSTCWNASSVIKILKNEKYAGDLVQKKTYTPDFLTHEKRTNHGEVPVITLRDHHEAIVSRELWDAAQARIEKNNRRNGSTAGHSDKLLFSGKIKCGKCGAGFLARQRRLKDGRVIRRWSCGSGCGVGHLLRDDDALHMLKTALMALDIPPEPLAADLAGALEAAPGNMETLLKTKQSIENKKLAMLDSFFAGDISREEMLALGGRYDEQLRNINAKISAQESLCASDKESLKTAILPLLRGEKYSEAYYKQLLHSITVHEDSTFQLRLKNISRVFIFAAD